MPYDPSAWIASLTPNTGAQRVAMGMSAVAPTIYDLQNPAAEAAAEQSMGIARPANWTPPDPARFLQDGSPVFNNNTVSGPALSSAPYNPAINPQAEALYNQNHPFAGTGGVPTWSQFQQQQQSAPQYGSIQQYLNTTSGTGTGGNPGQNFSNVLSFLSSLTPQTTTAMPTPA